jgi:hypothetical protein
VIVNALFRNLAIDVFGVQKKIQTKFVQLSQAAEKLGLLILVGAAPAHHARLA